jgi:hypothetical protein
VVELTLALHYVFNTPEDKIIFDVGHQAYIHKILTGRRGKMGTIRQQGGLSGGWGRAGVCECLRVLASRRGLVRAGRAACGGSGVGQAEASSRTADASLLAWLFELACWLGGHAVS